MEIRASQDLPAHFTWAIRDWGKLDQCSDKPLPSETLARAAAEAEIAWLLEVRSGVPRSPAGLARLTCRRSTGSRARRRRS